MKIRRRANISPVEKGERRAFYIIMAPFLIMFLVYRLYPMAWGVYMSFTNYSGFNQDTMKFVGFANYLRVFSDGEAMPALLRTFVIGVVVIPTSIIIWGLDFIGHCSIFHLSCP